MAHTPGPWADICGYITIKGGRNVASVNSHNTTEGKANARLIASAPDMVEAGRKLAAEVGGLRAFEHEVRAAIGNTNWSVLMDRLAGMDAAIAKATGSQA
jgi:hypothetical protein